MGRLSPGRAADRHPAGAIDGARGSAAASRAPEDIKRPYGGPPAGRCDLGHYSVDSGAMTRVNPLSDARRCLRHVRAVAAMAALAAIAVTTIGGYGAAAASESFAPADGRWSTVVATAQHDDWPW